RKDCHEERRHTQRPRAIRPASRADWRLQRSHRARLAGKCQETRGHPDQGFAAHEAEPGDLNPGLPAIWKLLGRTGLEGWLAGPVGFVSRSWNLLSLFSKPLACSRPLYLFHVAAPLMY